MLLFLKILVLLWFVNLVPPLLAHFLMRKWDAPLDGGRLFLDGKPLFGPHKTVRGIVGGIAGGVLISLLIGVPWWVGALSGALSMAGDLTSSFFKRRWEKPSGTTIPVFDQGIEGSLPFLVLGPYFSLSAWQVLFIAALFCLGAYVGSWFLNRILLRKPFAGYPRPVAPNVRLREWRACQITSNPLHHFINFEDCIYYHFFMKTALRALGVYEKGQRNALDLQRNDVTFSFPDLPPAFDGYTILFLTDLHLDGLKGLPERLESIVKTMTVDLCILGGDLRMETHGPFAEALLHLRRLLPHIRSKDGIYGVLGNHDCTEIIEPLGEDGVEFLVNDATPIGRGEDRIWVVGVDDPHYYKCHDIERAFEGVPPEDFRIFVAHSNECYLEASRHSPQLYLCGHTHAGQIRLPGLGMVFTHSSAPRSLCEGPWRHNGMLGFTSCGVGVSGVPVRFSTRGEVTLITLRKAAIPQPEVRCSKCGAQDSSSKRSSGGS